MKKKDELARGCMARAYDDEETFVLLSRDEVAPFAIEEWVQMRISAGLNEKGDRQMSEALDRARKMREQRYEIRLRMKQEKS